MIVYHVLITAADDYLARRAAHRAAHLERIAGLRDRGVCIAGGPAPDGRTADLFYRVGQPGDLKTIVEDDPYWKGGVWTGYEPRAFSQFVEPWESPPIVTDGSRRVVLVDGTAPDPEMASFAMIEARGAGRLVLGGLFPGDASLAMLRAPDVPTAVDWLAATGLFERDSLRGRPLLYVL